MGEINIVDILKLGLPGLVFLLSLLSFYLLTKEQEKTSPSLRMLKSIRQFMCVNILLAVLTLAAPIIDQLHGGSSGMDIFSVAAKADGDNLVKGNAAVCTSVSYANRHLLVKDITTGRAIQVFARSVIPCANGMHISLTPEDATSLGWPAGEISSVVEVVPAAVGQMFVL
jgi:hypothetical protein